MNRYDFYKEFIKGNTIRLKELFEEIHATYALRNELYEFVKEYKVVVIACGINFDAMTRMLEAPVFNKTITHSNARKKLPPDLNTAIKQYSQICNYKIPKLEHEMKITRLLVQTPDRMYFRMQYWFNREVGNHILRGGVYSFGQNLSRLGISYVLRSKNAKPVPDWGESNKLKAELIRLGITPKSKDAPDGVKWLLFRTDEGYCFWKWRKEKVFVPNKKMYKFRSIATNNECTDYNGTLTQEQILNKSIGTFDKMMALLKLNPQIIERYDF